MTYLKHDDKKKQEGAEKPAHTEPEQAQTPRERSGGPEDYGRYYWCVKTDISEDGEIYVYADEVRFTPDGGVLFLGRREDKTEEPTNLALAPGHWSAIYAASCWDGGAVAVEHWKGEVVQ